MPRTYQAMERRHDPLLREFIDALCDRYECETVDAIHEWIRSDRADLWGAIMGGALDAAGNLFEQDQDAIAEKRAAMEAMCQQELDDLVHDFHANAASAINNEGPEGQIAFLLGQVDVPGR